MSRWLDAARRARLSAKPPFDETHRTDETQFLRVSSVLSKREVGKVDPFADGSSVCPMGWTHADTPFAETSNTYETGFSRKEEYASSGLPATAASEDGVAPSPLSVRSKTGDTTAREAGFANAAADRRQLLSDWHCGLERLSATGQCRSGNECVQAALSFIRDGWADRALDAGWAEQELVWADEKAPWACYDRMGAAYFPGKVAKITACRITRVVRDGPELVLLRRRGDGRGDVPWRTLDG